jgi:hypothetical protein
MFFGFIFCLSACSQNKKMSNLTSKNYIETMFNSIKRYNYEPMYFLSYEQNVCYSEIFVNDIPVNKNFAEVVNGGTFEINNYIFKSGTQKVTLRLYATGKTKDFDFPALAKDTDMKIEITEANNKNRDIKGKEVATYVTPLDVNVDAEGYKTSKFKFTGQKYVELSFTFEAKVPYEFTSLDKARDLSKLKKDILEEKVVDFYKNQWKILNEKRKDDFFSYLDLKERETCQSLFYNKDELQETLQAYLEPFVINDYKLEPLENYQLKLYGAGKIVCLELLSLDSRLRGESAIWGKYKEEGGTMATFRKYYLYIPEGENELKIIR